MLLEHHVEPGDQHHQMGSPRRTINTRRANLIRTTSYPNSPRRSRRLNYPETQGVAPHRGSPPRSHLAQVFGRRAPKPDEVMPSAAAVAGAASRPAASRLATKRLTRIMVSWCRMRSRWNEAE